MRSSSKCIVLWATGSKTPSMGAMQRPPQLIENPIANLFLVKPAIDLKAGIGGVRGSQELLASVRESSPAAAETLHEHISQLPSDATVLTALSLEQIENHISEKRAAPAAAGASSGFPSRTPPAPDSPLVSSRLRNAPPAPAIASLALPAIGSPTAASSASSAAITVSRPLNAKLTNRLSEKRELYLRRRHTADLSLALALVGILFAVTEVELRMDLELHHQNSTSYRSFAIEEEFLVP